MQIGMNAIDFLPASMGGVETYLKNLLIHLQRIDHEHKYLVLCNDKNHNHIVKINNNFETKAYTITRPSPQWFIHRVIKKVFFYDVMKPILNRLQIDVLHHPFTVLNPIDLKFPSVLTFHDLQQEFYPEFFSKKALRWRKKTYKLSLEKATIIIAISKYVKDTIMKNYEIDENKIEVIHNACGSEFHVIEDVDKINSIQKKYDLERPFMFYPAATWPHKNHLNLVKAMKLMTERYKYDGGLVLSGLRMQHHEQLLRIVELSRLGGRVKILGYLPQEELSILYNLARVMVFPSLYEGFGIPLVEAMACGCPVVCSNVTSIPEVVGEAAVMFSPDSVEDMAEKIWEVWNDDRKRKSLRGMGFERVKMFSWDETARKTKDIYLKAAQRD